MLIKKHPEYVPSTPLPKLAEETDEIMNRTFLSGEGWLIPAEMAAFAEHGTNNIICTQPFGCLPNHVVGKGVIKEVRRQHPEANIAAIDFDPGASEVNQLNRIKLMLATAVSNL